MSTRNDPTPLDCKVYVGDLGSNGNRTEIENAFAFYGPLKEVWVARNPPGFAFVMFQDSRDARDAVRALDGKIICDRRVKVELSSGKSRHEQSRFENGHRGSGGSSRYSSRGDNDRPYSRPASHHDSRRYGDDRGNNGYSRNHGFTRSRSRSPPMAPISRGDHPPRTPSVHRSPNFAKSFDPSRSNHHPYGRI